MWAEPARHDRIESVAPLILAGECSHVGTHHPHAMTPPQRCHGALEGVGAFGSSVDQGDMQLGSQLGNHQAGHSGARPKVNNVVAGVGECKSKRTGVLDDFANRAKAKRADALCVGQDLVNGARHEKCLTRQTVLALPQFDDMDRRHVSG